MTLLINYNYSSSQFFFCYHIFYLSHILPLMVDANPIGLIYYSSLEITIRPLLINTFSF